MLANSKKNQEEAFSKFSKAYDHRVLLIEKTLKFKNLMQPQIKNEDIKS